MEKYKILQNWRNDTRVPLKCSNRWSNSQMNFNVLGEPTDNLVPIDTRIKFPIYRYAFACIQFKYKIIYFWNEN